MTVADGPYPQDDQVGRADQLDHGEHGDRAGHHGAGADGDEHHLDVGTGGVAQDGGQGGPAAEGHAPADDEQDAGPRHDDQEERRDREGEQSVEAPPWPATVPIESPGHRRFLRMPRQYVSVT